MYDIKATAIDWHEPNGFMSMGTFDGRGSCANTIQANKCRERARAEIGACMTQLWLERDINKIPSRCNTLVSGSSRNCARLTYDGIMVISRPFRLTARAARYICCQMRPDASAIQAQFYAIIVGDEKCGKVKTGNNNYQDEVNVGNVTFHCDGWRENGICG